MPSSPLFSGALKLGRPWRGGHKRRGKGPRLTTLRLRLVQYRPDVNAPHLPRLPSALGAWTGGDRGGARKGHRVNLTGVWGSGDGCLMGAGGSDGSCDPLVLLPRGSVLGRGQSREMGSQGQERKCVNQGQQPRQTVPQMPAGQGRGSLRAAGHGPLPEGSTVMTADWGQLCRWTGLKDTGSYAATPDDISFVLLYCMFVFFPFLGPLLQHMEVPRLGSQSELQLPA